ncbi:hypothetical protein WMY93_014873 [Mugilogobius chulae]|uniref:NAD(P)(+)--arginine ADP-ribosyltransferase n=1 Tax=Mugilogobius chulae TaxID=88201 RepID=A0AAW0NY39_9GOBI
MGFKQTPNQNQTGEMRTTMLALILGLVIFATPSHQIPLTMMEESVDDMYEKCSAEMAAKVDSYYFPEEIKNNNFKNAWNLAKSFAKTKYKNRPDKELTLNQVQAIYVYTQEFPKLYEEFNAIVRDGKAKYTTPAFPYHALHFWLTTALQIISKNKPCQTTYRRSRDKFTGQENQEMRFEFYSGKSESEILIPPYEKFKIIKAVDGSYEELKDCKKVYVIKSTGKTSNLDCKAI